MPAPLQPMRLWAAVAAVAPISGVSVGAFGVPASVRIDFLPTATAAQQAAAQNVVNAFDWSDAAQTTWENAGNPERTDLRSDAQANLNAIATYVALANPTAAQTTAQVKLLSRAVAKLIKRLQMLN